MQAVAGWENKPWLPAAGGKRSANSSAVCRHLGSSLWLEGPLPTFLPAVAEGASQVARDGSGGVGRVAAAGSARP